MTKKNLCLYVFLITFILLNISIIYAANINILNKENYFRIHIVANSDSIDDQLIKYKIAKEINEYISNITKDSVSKYEAKKNIYNNIDNIITITNSLLKENNIVYNCKIFLGEMYYDEKTKDESVMPAGIYDSLKIVLGNGKGQNWWSLIYPESITVDKKEDLTDTEDGTTSNNVEYKFKIFELFKKILNY